MSIRVNKKSTHITPLQITTLSYTIVREENCNFPKRKTNSPTRLCPQSNIQFNISHLDRALYSTVYMGKCQKNSDGRRQSLIWFFVTGLSESITFSPLLSANITQVTYQGAIRCCQWSWLQSNTPLVNLTFKCVIIQKILKNFRCCVYKYKYYDYYCFTVRMSLGSAERKRNNNINKSILAENKESFLIPTCNHPKLIRQKENILFEQYVSFRPRCQTAT